MFQKAAGKGAGAWQNAAVAATGEGSAEAPTINSTFAAFDEVTVRTLDDRAATVDVGLTRGHLGLLLLTWIAIVVGVIAASWTGISQRLEEYR